MENDSNLLAMSARIEELEEEKEELEDELEEIHSGGAPEGYEPIFLSGELTFNAGEGKTLIEIEAAHNLIVKNVFIRGSDRSGQAPASGTHWPEMDPSLWYVTAIQNGTKNLRAQSKIRIPGWMFRPEYSAYIQKRFGIRHVEKNDKLVITIECPLNGVLFQLGGVAHAEIGE